MAVKPPPKSSKRRRPAHATPKPKTKRSPLPRVPINASDVKLVSAKGTVKRGGGPGGEAWRIEVHDKTAGRVFINFIDEPAIGPHASIQIFLNQAHQGLKIGRVGYRKACEASSYDAIYAHMRKSNIASWRAAEEAGFVDATPPDDKQKVMLWRRMTR